jgi:hypothetical protein
MNPFQPKHRRCVPVLAAALLVAVSSVALAEQEAAPQRSTNWFWSWLTPSPAPAAPRTKPATPARVAGQTEQGKSNCSFWNCITLVGIGF